MKSIATYPISEEKVNLAKHNCLTLFPLNELCANNYRDKINDSFIFLLINELYTPSSDTNKIKIIFENLLKNNYCILYNDHKTDVDLFVDNLHFYMEKYKVNPNKIFVILYLPSEVDDIRKKLNAMGYNKIHVTYKMNWLLWTKYYFKPKPEVVPTYKFSVFVRRFSDWRFLLYCKLIENDILDNTVFTFSNNHPDFQNSEVSKDDMIRSIENVFSSEITHKIQKWIDTLPVQLNDGTAYPVSDIIFSKLLQSHIHIVCETHVHSNGSGVCLTEKIYKPLVAGKPFIVVGQHKILKLLRDQGFRTFHPIIDESYDDIQDYKLRLDAICKELKRINELPSYKLLELVDQCNEVIQHNLRIVDQFWTESFPANYKKLNIFG